MRHAGGRFQYTPDNEISEISYSNLAGNVTIGATTILDDADGNVTSEVSTNGSGTDWVAFDLQQLMIQATA